MEWLERLNKSIDFLEKNICDEVNIAGAAEIACLSKYHFQRMFHLVTGVTIAEYVRKRRLTLAAQELVTTDVKVIDVALKYGYSTPESFSKAFSRLHGVSPSNASKAEEALTAYPKLSFQIQLKGVEKMDYKIVEKDGFKIVGKAIRVSSENGENYKRIPEFWGECYSNGTCDKLAEKMGQLGIMGVCMEGSEDGDKFTYVVAIEKPEEEMDIDLVEKEIPAANWAVFQAIGPMPDAIQNVWKSIYSEWFPSTGYKHTGGPELEVYYPGDSSAEDYKSEVWIPIIKD
ncbi:MAG: effector binding domain-containing protein [Halanaerobiales bacterium]